MKKILVFGAIVMAMFTSCNTLYVQTVDIKSADMASGDTYKYSDGNVTINYNFWSQNGNPGFVVENNTDQIIYLDLSKSFYVSGGTAKDYFLNRTFSSSSSLGEAISATGTATAYGTWEPSGFLGSITKSISKGVTKGASKGVSYAEKPIIAIPAHCQKTVYEYCIQSVPLQDCSVKMFPNSRGSQFRYAEGQMPEFSNIITYRVGEKGEDKTIRNKFYISGFSNYKQNDVIKKEKVGCKETGTIKTYTTASPKSFYIIYTNQTNNRYSEDAKREAM